MKRDRNTTDQLVNIWVEDLLLDPNKLLALPLSNHSESPWKVNILSNFVSIETAITISEAQRRKHLTLPLIEKMNAMGILIQGASSKENMARQRILHWYNTLNLDDKKQLPRMLMYPNNISFTSLGVKQRTWATDATQSKYIANTIDEIHEDLVKLGIIGPDFKKIGDRKRPIKEIRSAIQEWIFKTIDDENALWEIPITKADTPAGFNVAVWHIKKLFGISYTFALSLRELTYPIIEKMIQKKILIAINESDGVQSIEIRRKLLNWYRKLSINEKQLLPIFANRVSLKQIPSEKRPINKSDSRYDVVKNAWNEIHHDLEELGIINTNYKNVAERNIEKEKQQQKTGETQKERFNKLAIHKLNIISDLIEPTKAEPFIQIEQIFASQIKTIPSGSGKDNYINGCTIFIKFLSKLYGIAPLTITTTFDEHLLSRFRNFLQQQIINNEISSNHANTILSTVRQTLYRTTQIVNFEYNFFDTNGFDTIRNTDVKKPFTKNERLLVGNAIEEGLKNSRLSQTPYKKTGIGKNPLDKNGKRIRGMSTLNNARWLFENHLNCNPIYYNNIKSPIEKAFLQIISDSEKGLMETYHEWGVPPMIGIDILTPYLLKLAQVTGLNANSILSLDIDDYIPSHSATSRPCLRYWKERSNGYKEYHLDLDPTKAQLTWLTSTQSVAVKKIFEEVRILTSGIRQYVEDERFKNRLFIYMSYSTKKHGKVIPILGNKEKNTALLSDSFTRFINRYMILDKIMDSTSL